MPSNRLFITWTRSSTDQQDHAITDENNAQTRQSGSGLPEALCGHHVATSSLTIPPGQRCQQCRTILRAHTTLFDPELRMTPRPRRHTRALSFLHRLFHRPARRHPAW